jgi:hypothetical protein
MKSKLTAVFFLIPTLIFLFACQNQSGREHSEFLVIDTLSIHYFDEVISTESGLLADPRELVIPGDQQIAVYDHGVKRIILFDHDGNKHGEFGNTGRGPGEWDSMGGAADLNFAEGRFFSTNRERFLFDLYDREGNHQFSVPFPQYMRYSQKQLLPGSLLLVTTGGREDALAVTLDLNDHGKITEKIGLPEAEPFDVRNFEEERLTYASGDIPEHAFNEALAVKNDNGYFILMNTLGELRRYNTAGDLIFRKSLPENVLHPIFDFIVRQNRETSPHSAVPLRYVQKIQLNGDLVYLLIPKIHPEADELDSRLLVYNNEGTLLEHLVFPDPGNEFFFYDFAVSPDNTLFLIDILNARIMKLELDAI